MNCVLIHNAPFVFQTIWKVLAPMLPPDIKAKIQMTKKPEDLYVHISKEHLVNQLGGNNDWKWKYTPVEKGENELQSDEKKRDELLLARQNLITLFTELNKKILSSRTSSEAGEVARLKREKVITQMRIGWFEIDRYVRGRGVYHRHGNIVGNGLVRFDYGEEEVEVLGYFKSKEKLEQDLKILEEEIIMLEAESKITS